MSKTASATLGELCRPKQWPTLSKAEMLPDGFPVYGANGRIGYTDTFTHEEPTILVGCRGSCGSVHVTVPRAYANGNAMALDALDTTRVDLGFLAAFLRHRGFADVTTGTSQPQIIAQNISRISVPLPPMEEQRRIAAILDQADALRAKRRAALAHLDTLAQSIFLDMFGDPATNPKGWPRLKLGDAFWFQEGPGVRKWQFRSEGVKLLNVANIEKDGRLNLDKTTRFVSEEEAFGKYRHFLVDPGDLVIASSGISFDDDGMLRTRGAFVSPEHLPLCMNTSTVRFKAKHGLSDLRFLKMWLSGVEFRSQITKLVTGTAQQNFGPSHLSALSVTLPPFALQQDFSGKLESLEKVSSAHTSSLRSMTECFSALQERAFQGAL